MRPIQDPGEVRPTNVLYHSAFGFARVRGVDGGQVQLQWEQPGENLPQRVGGEVLLRAWSLCRPGGFFDRAFNQPDALREQLQVDPSGAVALLLEDLGDPQRRDDLKDWISGRGLLPREGFDAWWDRVRPTLTEDARFQVGADQIGLRASVEADPRERLKNPLISPSRRLELAMAHRDALGEEAFLEHVLVAWRVGASRVRDLALAAAGDFPPDRVIEGLLGPGTDSVDAVIHAIRNAGWSPDRVSEPIRRKLLDRMMSGLASPNALDAEGRLASTLWRWGLPGAVDALARVAGTHRGQDLADAALAALPPRRAEALGVAMMESVLAVEGDGPGAAWLARWLLDHTEDTPAAMAQRLESGHPPVSARIAREIESRASSVAEFEEVPMESEEGPHTVEITKEVFQGPVSLAELPPRGDRTFLSLGLALARALARHHAQGRVVSPTRETTKLHPDGTVEIGLGGDPRLSPRPPGEAPSKTADVYAAAVVLIEVVVGRTWPRQLPGDRAVPFLRHVAPELPASALAPLAIALDPLAQGRPADAISWVLQWQAAAAAEEARSSLAHDPRVRMRLGFDTHVGRMKILHTQTNQDALYVSAKGPLALMCVCDGISTANTGSGDLAAGITTQVVASLWDQWLPRLVQHKAEDAHEFVDRALRMANQAVCEASLRLAGGNLEGRVPMGTTAIVAIAQGNRVSLGWLGDSRAFVVGPYGASQLTADANQAGERMVDWHRGLSPTFDATGFALVRYVGHFDELGHAEPLPALHAQLLLLPDERLVLCSDGITDYIADSQAEVSGVLASEVSDETLDPDEVARKLVDLANRGGGGDNATVIVAAPS
jgi:serine/threonine protein phosphatase PrpC